METTEIYRSPSYDKNDELSKKGYDERCVCCNKPMISNQVKFIVHMTTDWVAVDTEDLEVVTSNGFTSQGFFPVGSECKKHIPKNFIFKT